MLICLGLITSGVSRAQNVNADSARVRSKVNELGVGRRVEIELRDDSRLKGKIGVIEPYGFTVIDEKTSTEQRVSYDDVTTIKKASSGLSTKSWIIIGAAAAGAAVTWTIVKPAICDGGAQTRGPC